MTRGCSKHAALIAAAVAFWPAAMAHAQTAAPAEGTYCLTGVREVGSCLRLSADATFEYFLAYGADVVLDSPPYDKAPTFSFQGFRAAEGDGFDVVVVSKAGNPINGFNVRATCDGRSIDVGVTGTGFAVACKSAPTEIALGLEMFGLAYKSIEVSAPAGADKAYVFAFDPGDLGNKRFAATRLQRKGPDSLVMTYANPAIAELDGKTFTYERERE
jgi:hypothetical protein